MSEMSGGTESKVVCLFCDQLLEELVPVAPHYKPHSYEYPEGRWRHAKGWLADWGWNTWGCNPKHLGPQSPRPKCHICGTETDQHGPHCSAAGHPPAHATPVGVRVLDSFRGPTRYLSNFYSVDVEFEGLVYRSTEHAYQAAKFEDIDRRKRIQAMEKFSQAKNAGNEHGIRQHWDNMRLGVMEYLVRQKFRNPELGTKLLATWPDELIEGNDWNDVFWGVCAGKGENNLGKVLMKVRWELRQASL